MSLSVCKIVKLPHLKPTQWFCKISFLPCPSPGEAEPEGAGCWGRPRREQPHRGSPAAGRGAAPRPSSARQDAPRLVLLSKQGSPAELCSTAHLTVPSAWSASCRCVGVFRHVFLVLFGPTRSPQKSRQTLSRRERGLGLGLVFHCRL